MREDHVKAIFLLAGFEVEKTFQIENKYWPEAYVELRKASPWWLVKTEYGMIEIGWQETGYVSEQNGEHTYDSITDDNVTRGPCDVHAYSVPKAVEYMTALRRNIDFEKAEKEKASRSGGSKARVSVGAGAVI
jgi:hypothetical protein